METKFGRKFGQKENKVRRRARVIRERVLQGIVQENMVWNIRDNNNVVKEKVREEKLEEES